jgi:DnaJ-class molecular chaperone
MEFRDYYATLGVPKTATEKEIKQAYRKLARKYHPDVNPGDKKAEARFKEINEAYEVLGDPEKRRKYDELGANWRLYEQAQPGYGAPGGGFWTVNVGGPGGAYSVEHVDELFGDDSPFSDFFRTFFGGAGPGRARTSRTARRRPGADLEQDIHLTLEEAYTGVTRRIAVKAGGHTRTVDVRIPAGVKDGARVRVAGEGEPGTGGAGAGDLYLRVHVLPHATFERRGQDLYVTVPVPLTTAVLGGEAEVPTPGGRTLRLRIPEATQNGQVFRLRGHGMPTPGRPHEVGDLFATVQVQLPRRLTPETRRHFEALRKLETER